MNGDWEKEDYYGNIEDGFTDLAPFGKLVDQADVIVLNTCCIRENADNKLYGTLGHLAGETISFGDQMSIDWFVKGVEGNPAG